MRHDGDEASIDELELSVRAANVCHDHGIKTVGDLRAADLKQLGLGSKMHRKAIATALAKWDSGGATMWINGRSEYMARARNVLSALTDKERRQLFQEIGACNCLQLTALMVKRPAIGAGALLGAFVGALLSPSPSKQISSDQRCLCPSAGLTGGHLSSCPQRYQ